MPMPVETSALPDPSRSSSNVIFVSLVSRLIDALRLPATLASLLS